MNIYITTTTPIGKKCAAWAVNNPVPGATVVSEMERCDIFFSIFHNELLSIEFISKRKRCFNFHGGLLPEYRGSGTINWAIINGEIETGVTLHEIDVQIDHGPIIAVNRIPIMSHDTAKSLYQKMEAEIFMMFRSWYGRLVALDYAATPQDHAKARLYTRADLQAAKDLTRFVRAFEFPGKENAFFINGAGEKIHLKFDA